MTNTSLIKYKKTGSKPSSFKKKQALQLFELFQKEFVSLKDGIFSHIYVIDHDKETKEVNQQALKKLQDSGDAYRIDYESDYSKRPTVYRQKYRILKSIKSSLTLVLQTAYPSQDSIEFLLRDFGFWFKSHFKSYTVTSDSVYFYNDVQIKVSIKSGNLVVQFIAL